MEKRSQWLKSSAQKFPDLLPLECLSFAALAQEAALYHLPSCYGRCELLSLLVAARTEARARGSALSVSLPCALTVPMTAKWIQVEIASFLSNTPGCLSTSQTAPLAQRGSQPCPKSQQGSTLLTEINL